MNINPKTDRMSKLPSVFLPVLKYITQYSNRYVPHTICMMLKTCMIMNGLHTCGFKYCSHFPQYVSLEPISFATALFSSSTLFKSSSTSLSAWKETRIIIQIFLYFMFSIHHLCNEYLFLLTPGYFGKFKITWLYLYPELYHTSMSNRVQNFCVIINVKE